MTGDIVLAAFFLAVAAFFAWLAVSGSSGKQP